MDTPSIARTTRVPAGTVARQDSTPQVATMRASRTSDTYSPSRARVEETDASRPGLAVAINVRAPDVTSVVACSAGARPTSTGRRGVPARRKSLPLEPVATSSEPSGSTLTSYGASSRDSQTRSQSPSGGTR